MRAKLRGLVDKFQSTHPARGATGIALVAIGAMTLFQSTHPARGATVGCFNQIQPMSDFNPRTPRGVRQHQER